MLALDKTLKCIDADESEVLTVYQSQAPVSIAAAGLQHAPCEAYVCAVRKNDLLRVYVALLTDKKKILIYSTPNQPDSETALAAALREGVAFAEVMGFTMDRLNLNYSAAMRSVVVRNLAVLRPPRGMKGTTRRGGAEPVTLRRHERVAVGQSGGKGGIEDVAVAPQLPASDELAALQAELLSGQAEIEAADVLQVELAAARAENTLMNREHQRLQQALSSSAESLSRALSENMLLKEKTAKQEQSLAEHAAALAAAQAQHVLAEQTEEAARCLREKLTILRNHLAELQEEKETEAAQAASALAALQNERDKLAAEREELRLRLGREETRKGEGRSEVEQLLGEKAHAEGALVALQATLAEITATATREASAFAALQDEREKLAAEREEIRLSLGREQARCGEKISDLKRLQREKAHVEKSLVALQTTLAETAVAATAKEGEFALRHEALLAEVTALKTALAAQRAAREDDAAAAIHYFPLVSLLPDVTLAEVEDVSPPAVAEAKPALPVATPSPIGFFGDEVPDHFSPFDFATGDDAPIVFSLDTTMGWIAYGNPEEVVALHQSLNVARITLDGESQQNSKAFICSVRRGAGVHVVVALYLMETGRTVVYVPEEQPQDDVAYARTLRDAVLFAETVGFMMGADDLCADQMKRGDLLYRIPVLRREKE